MTAGDADGHGPITSEIFARFLRCELEAYLHTRGVIGADREFADWQHRSRERYKQAALAVLRSRYSDEQIHIGMPPAAALKQGRWRLIIDGTVATPSLRTCVDAADLAHPVHNGPPFYYRPIRFAPANKVSKSDKLLLAFDALAISRITGVVPPTGRLVYGDHYARTTLRLAQLIREVRLVLSRIATLRARTVPPQLLLNKHCADCEFRSRCRADAIERDDLSLLTGLNQKALSTWNGKGVSTVTQLSYAFRPRRYSRRRPSKPAKHDPALKALALRKNQVHVVGTPTWTDIDNPVYFDVEGVPDRDFYYLIGLRYRNGDDYICRSFWADDPSKEGEMWAACLRDLQSINAPRLIHYGSYETHFLKQMKSRYSTFTADSNLIDHLVSSSLNLISFTYAQIYFPTYSNTLKEIARFLNFQWSDSNASGLTSLMWRSEWEESSDPSVKQKLISYNADDCEAVQRLSEAIASICREQELYPADAGSVNISGLISEFPRCFGPLQYAVPAFEKINTAAYWDYQRTKVYVRSNERLRRISRAQSRPRAKYPSLNKSVQTEENCPTVCPKCNSTKFYRNGRYKHLVVDLRFSAGGIRRWIVEYRFTRYQCRHCKNGYNELPRQERFGQSLKAYVIYQIIELRISQNAVGRNMDSLFGLTISRNAINSLKGKAARQYDLTYKDILRRIGTGPVVHVDETKILIGSVSRYVWVFTNMEDVAYVYSESRDAGIAKTVLAEFRGILVSDFYAGYDSFDCPQQKCLIHLMRDVNGDVLRDPFNIEMREMAQKFAGLLRPMVSTIDRFGLKTYHLRKHRRSVDLFYRALSVCSYKTEVALAYKKRFEKNRDKLFTFLDHDGVPWNNNNAEHAIKAFALLRNVIGPNSTPKGINEYLVLLSISETCKCRGVDFLSFLRSGELDIDSLANNRCGGRVPDQGAQVLIPSH
jgi:predicted RecB family nuclease